MSNQTADKEFQSFSDAFFGALVAAMSENSGSVWAIAAMPDKDSVPTGIEPVWMKIALGGSLRGAFMLEFRHAEAVLLASKLLRHPVEEFGAEPSEALKKLIEGALNKFRSSLEHEYGTFTIESSFASEAPSSHDDRILLTACDGGTAFVSVLMGVNPELAESLLLHSRAVSSVAGARKAMVVVEGNAVPEPVNLDLVMDVELNVTLRFGQRQLTLREVMDLTSGSVVELDRQVEEPVELLLNGMVIARGEAVVIDGNYGLRVTEVSQPVSSLTLH